MASNSKSTKNWSQRNAESALKCERRNQMYSRRLKLYQSQLDRLRSKSRYLYVREKRMFERDMMPLLSFSGYCKAALPPEGPWDTEHESSPYFAEYYRGSLDEKRIISWRRHERDLQKCIREWEASMPRWEKEEKQKQILATLEYLSWIIENSRFESVPDATEKNYDREQGVDKTDDHFRTDSPFGVSVKMKDGESRDSHQEQVDVFKSLRQSVESEDVVDEAPQVSAHGCDRIEYEPAVRVTPKPASFPVGQWQKQMVDAYRESVSKVDDVKVERRRKIRPVTAGVTKMSPDRQPDRRPKSAGDALEKTTRFSVGGSVPDSDLQVHDNSTADDNQRHQTVNGVRSDVEVTPVGAGRKLVSREQADCSDSNSNSSNPEGQRVDKVNQIREASRDNNREVKMERPKTAGVNRNKQTADTIRPKTAVCRSFRSQGARENVTGDLISNSSYTEYESETPIDVNQTGTKIANSESRLIERKPMRGPVDKAKLRPSSSTKSNNSGISHMRGLGQLGDRKTYKDSPRQTPSPSGTKINDQNSRTGRNSVAGEKGSLTRHNINVHNASLSQNKSKSSYLTDKEVSKPKVSRVPYQGGGDGAERIVDTRKKIASEMSRHQHGQGTRVQRIKKPQRVLTADSQEVVRGREKTWPQRDAAVTIPFHDNRNLEADDSVHRWDSESDEYDSSVESDNKVSGINAKSALMRGQRGRRSILKDTAEAEKDKISSGNETEKPKKSTVNANNVKRRMSTVKRKSTSDSSSLDLHPSLQRAGQSRRRPKVVTKISELLELYDELYDSEDEFDLDNDPTTKHISRWRKDLVMNAPEGIYAVNDAGKIKVAIPPAKLKNDLDRLAFQTARNLSTVVSKSHARRLRSRFEVYTTMKIVEKAVKESGVTVSHPELYTTY